MLERVRVRKRSHTSPRIQHRICSPDWVSNRHLGRQYRAERRVDAFTQTRELGGPTRQEHVLKHILPISSALTRARATRVGGNENTDLDESPLFGFRETREDAL